MSKKLRSRIEAMTKLKGEPMTDPTPKPLAPLVSEISRRQQVANEAREQAERNFPSNENLDPWKRDAFVAGWIARDNASRAKDHDLMREIVTAGGAMLITNKCHNGGDFPVADCCEACTASLSWTALLTSLTERINTH